MAQLSSNLSSVRNNTSSDDEPSLLYILTVVPCAIAFSIWLDWVYISPCKVCFIWEILPTSFSAFDLFNLSKIFSNSTNGITLFCLHISTMATYSSKIFFLSLGSFVRILSMISNKKLPNSSLCADYLLYLNITMTRISLRSHYWINTELVDLDNYCFSMSIAGMNNFSLKILLFFASVPKMFNIFNALSNYFSLKVLNRTQIFWVTS